MSELKPCPFCGWRVDDEDGSKNFIWCDGCERRFQMSVNWWNKRHDPNPWRYPSRGELPENDGEYLVSVKRDKDCSYVDTDHWAHGEWIACHTGEIYAWKFLEEPAPELEKGEE